MDNIGENIYAKSANSAKSKANKLSTQSQGEKRRTSSVSNELSSLANQLNVTNDIVSDAPEVESVSKAEAEDQAQPEEAADDSKVDEATDTSSKNDLVVDDVNCSMSNENIEIESSTDPSSASEFVHLRKTTTALQSYLEQFQMENIKSNEGGETFDATEELLKMLDKENNES